MDDIAGSYMNLTVGAQSKVREPIGESLSNQEIFRRLAAALGVEEPALFESDASVISTLLQQMSYDGSFADLQAQGFFYVNGDEPLILHADRQFSTDSGRIEVASARAESMDLPRVPHARVDAEPPAGQFRLLSPASRWRLNDEYANDPAIQRRTGEAELWLCAADAAALGVADGASVEVSTELHSLQLVAGISDRVLPVTVLSYKGRWPKLEPGGIGLNALHKGEKSDMTEGTSVHGMLVSISPSGL